MFCFLKVLSLPTQYFRTKFNFINAAVFILTLVTALYIEQRVSHLQQGLEGPSFW